MAITYPAYRQCEGSDRNEITSVLADVAESGLIRGRTMYSEPTYELTLNHEGLSRDEYDAWESFWNTNQGAEFDIVWTADGQTYRGFASSPPSVSPDGVLWNVQVEFYVRKA